MTDGRKAVHVRASNPSVNRLEAMVVRKSKGQSQPSSSSGAMTNKEIRMRSKKSSEEDEASQGVTGKYTVRVNDSTRTLPLFKADQNEWVLPHL